MVIKTTPTRLVLPVTGSQLDAEFLKVICSVCNDSAFYIEAGIHYWACRNSPIFCIACGTKLVLNAQGQPDTEWAWDK